MYDTRIIYQTSGLRRFDLTPGAESEKPDLYLLRSGVEGLVGSWEYATVTIPGLPGVVRADKQILPIAGKLTLFYANRRVLDDFVDAFGMDGGGSLFVERRKAEGDGAPERWRLPLRLASLPESPDSSADEGGSVTLDVVADGGVWLSDEIRVDASGGVVDNVGDVPIWPWVEWKSRSQVTLPSGAVVELPAPSGGGPRRMSFSPEESGTVTDTRGVVDEKTKSAMRGGFFAEGVPAGARGRFTATGDATVFYQVARLSPWKEPKW